MIAPPRSAPPTPRCLIPLPATPDQDPAGWAEAVARGPGAVSVISTVDGAHTVNADALRALLEAGATPLARIEFSYATRPLPDVLNEIGLWATLPIAGFFFDQAPSSPYQVGPVVQAVRVARRLDRSTIVLNAGTAVDPIYRDLPATICTFEGTWGQYLSRPPRDHGDGHLVVDVPVDDLPVARALVLSRWAGLYLVTDRAAVFAATAAAESTARSASSARSAALGSSLVPRCDTRSAEPAARSASSARSAALRSSLVPRYDARSPER